MGQRNEWFDIREINEDIFVIEEPGHVQSYLIRGNSVAALIDTGMGFRSIAAPLEDLVRTPVVVFNTHWHFDHVGGNRLFEQTGIGRAEERLLTKHWRNELLVPLYVRPCVDECLRLPDGFVPDEYEVRSPPASFVLDDGSTFDLGGRVLEAIGTPGHTHGSFSFLDSATGSLFCGDFVYRATLYAHFRDSDVNEYIGSLRKVLACKDRIKSLHPGHGDPVLPPSFLIQVLHAFCAVKAGTVWGTVTEECGVLVSRHDFAGFAILAKAEGSPGIDLLHL